jgi:hypothetical protein
LGPGHYRGPRLTFPENVLLLCLTDGQKKIIQSETVHDMRRADAQERDDIVGQAAVAVHALPREQRGRRRQRAGKRRIPRVPSLGDRPDDACAGRRDARGVAAHVHPSHPMVRHRKPRGIHPAVPQAARPARARHPRGRRMRRGRRRHVERHKNPTVPRARAAQHAHGPHLQATHRRGQRPAQARPGNS